MPMLTSPGITVGLTPPSGGSSEPGGGFDNALVEQGGTESWLIEQGNPNDTVKIEQG